MADLPITGAQLANAQTIVSGGKSRGASDRDIQTALAVALAESSLQNLANSNVFESYAIPHDGVGSDHNSVGVFQQQVGIWGTAQDLMNTTIAANKFFDALNKVPHRDTLPIPAVAQQVQQSAFGDGSNYAAQVDLAQQIESSIMANGNYDTGTRKVITNADPLKWIMDGGNQKRIGLFLIGAVIIVFAMVKLLNDSGAVKAAMKVAAL